MTLHAESHDHFWGGLIDDFWAERQAQLQKWGVQRHPDGTGERYRLLADRYRADCQLAAANGGPTWRHILAEEVFEAFAETDTAKLRTELVQSAAVIAAWIEDIDNRESAVAQQIAWGLDYMRERYGEGNDL